MTASELFHAGRLQEAIDAQVAKVKNHPTDDAARLFLFELFLFVGDLDRARKQLDALQYDDPRHTAAIGQYRFSLAAETHRRAVFAGTEQPTGLTTAPDHVRLRLEVLSHLARDEQAAARKKLDEANQEVPVIVGTLNGKPFKGLADADERFGTVLEVFGTAGVYTWVAMEQIESITLNPPQSPRDVILRPAHLTLRDGVEGDVLLPGLYPRTYTSPDEALKLGRATEWSDSEIACGIGGKQFLINDELSSLNDWQAIKIISS